MVHVDVWQKPTQYCKAIILQLKINKLKKIRPTKAHEGRGWEQKDVYPDKRLPQLPDPAQDVTSNKEKTKTKMQDKIFVLFLFL